MPLSCANNGGTVSLIRLDQVPQLENETPLSPEALIALSHWQVKPGETLTVVDPQATSYRARITSLDPGHAVCVPFKRLTAPTESLLRIQVYQSLPDKERFELLLQKLTELGVDCIVPLGSQYSSVSEERDISQKKSHRWSEVVRKAARQCRRAMLPELMPVHTFAEALASAASAELRLILYEGDVSWSFMEGVGSFKPQSVALLVGPEGGFSQDEVVQAQAEGFLPVSLGPRTLHTETAAIVAVALMQGYLGDLG